MQSTRFALILAAGLVAFGAAQAQDVTGAGSSFGAPIYGKWAEAYSKVTGVHINYQSVGSGAGIKQIIAKTVDFGASDMPLSDADLAKNGLVQFPTVVGGVVPVVRIEGIKAGQIKMTGQILADIYQGKITNWNDKALVALNPGVNLPNNPISTVHRADASGTTFIFTDYLSKVSPDWKSKVGVSTSVNWPVGLGGKGNEGVSSYMQKLPNAIGYVEYAYAKQNNLAYVVMKNDAGAFVSPTPESFKAAAAGAEWNKSFYQVLTNEPGKATWPISGATFILMHATQEKPANGSQVLKFFDWSFANGDPLAAELVYVPLPESVKDMIRKEWSNKVKAADGKTVAFK